MSMFSDPAPPKLSVEDSKFLLAKKGMNIWKDRNDKIESVPSNIKNLHFFQIPSKGHKDKAYSIKVLNKTTIYLGISKSAGKKNATIKNAIKIFTKGDDKTEGLERSQWNEWEMEISADCCNFWKIEQKESGLNSITLPQIKTENFPFVMFIAGMKMMNS